MAGPADVEAWFVKKQHPQEPLMRKVRKAILDSDKRVQECIKWSCPTFTYEGNIASINPQAKAFVSLMFHQGAKIPGKFPSLKAAAAQRATCNSTTTPISRRRRPNSPRSSRPGAP